MDLPGGKMTKISKEWKYLFNKNGYCLNVSIQAISMNGNNRHNLVSAQPGVSSGSKIPAQYSWSRKHGILQVSLSVPEHTVSWSLGPSTSWVVWSKPLQQTHSMKTMLNSCQGRKRQRKLL